MPSLYLSRFSLKNNARQYPWQRYLDFFFLSITVVCYLILVYVGLSQNWGSDFPHYWTAARTLLSGANPYHSFLEFRNSPPAIGTQFVNPLWVALFFVPFGILPYEFAHLLWMIFLSLILLFSLVLIYKLARRDLQKWQAYLLAFAYLPFTIRLFQNGQLTLLPVLGGLLTLHLSRLNRDSSAGIVLASTAMKILPAFGILAAFIFTSVRNKNKTLAITAIITLLSFVIIPTMVWPGWLSSYSKVDFSASMGKTLPNGGFEIWPVASFTDFIHYCLPLNISSNKVILLQLLVIVIVILFGYYVWISWRKKICSFQFLLAVWSLIPLVILPYVRSYDHVITAFWFVGFFTDPSIRIDNRPAIFLGIVTYMGALAIRLTYHFEPWNFLVPTIILIGSSIVLVFINNKHRSR